MKGDTVVVTVAGLARSVAVTARKAGRTVSVARGTKWVVVAEMTAPSRVNQKGRQTGNILTIPVGAVLAIEEVRGDPAPPRAHKPKEAVPVGMGLDGTG